MNVQDFNLSLDLKEVLLWQHNEATYLPALIEAKQQFYNNKNGGFWTDWQTNVFNLDTANDFGVAVWAIILDLPLGENSGIPQQPFNIFGFAGSGLGNFYNANFAANLYSPATPALTLTEKKQLLKLKYGKLTTRCDVIGTNALLNNIFNGQMYVLQTTTTDEIIYVLTAPLPQKMIDIILNNDLLPRPAGWGVRFSNSAQPSWGFGQFNYNFNNGNFSQ